MTTIVVFIYTKITGDCTHFAFASINVNFMIKVNQFGCCSKEVQEFLKEIAFHGLSFEISPGIFTARTSTLLQRLSQYRQTVRIQRVGHYALEENLAKGNNFTGKD